MCVLMGLGMLNWSYGVEFGAWNAPYDLNSQTQFSNFFTLYYVAFLKCCCEKFRSHYVGAFQ